MGVSKLTVWTKELMFGDQRIQRAFDLEAKPITVTVVPGAVQIDPGAFSYPRFAAAKTGDFPLSVAMATVGSVASGEAYLLGFERRCMNAAVE